MEHQPSLGEDREVLLLLGRMDGKIDAILSEQSRQNDRIEGVETRLSKAEQSISASRGRIAGFAAAISILVTFTVTALKDKIIGLF